MKLTTAILLPYFTIEPAAASASKACWEIESSAQRLACFDQMVERQLDSGGSNSKFNPAYTLSSTTDKDYSLLNERWELEQDLVQFAFRPYKPVYFFPVFYSSRVTESPETPNPLIIVAEPFNLDYLESKLQLSFKTKLANDLLGQQGGSMVWLYPVFLLAGF